MALLTAIAQPAFLDSPGSGAAIFVAGNKDKATKCAPSCRNVIAGAWIALNYTIISEARDEASIDAVAQ